MSISSKERKKNTENDAAMADLEIKLNGPIKNVMGH